MTYAFAFSGDEQEPVSTHCSTLAVRWRAGHSCCEGFLKPSRDFFESLQVFHQNRGKTECQHHHALSIELAGTPRISLASPCVGLMALQLGNRAIAQFSAGVDALSGSGGSPDILGLLGRRWAGEVCPEVGLMEI